MDLTLLAASPVQANSIYVSNISLTDNGKNYYGSYIQRRLEGKSKTDCQPRRCVGTSSGSSMSTTEPKPTSFRVAPQPAARCTCFRLGPTPPTFPPALTHCWLRTVSAWRSATSTVRALGNSQKTNFAPRARLRLPGHVPNWLPAAVLASSTTASRTVDSHPTWERTIRSSSTFNTPQPTTGILSRSPVARVPAATFEVWLLLYAARPDSSQRQRPRPARNSVRLHHALHHERELHSPVSAQTHLDRPGRLRHIVGAAFGNVPQLQPSDSNPAG